jgi:hypothetical protein
VTLQVNFGGPQASTDYFGSLGLIYIPGDGGPVGVPEPGTLFLLGAGLLGLFLHWRRKGAL